VADAFGLFVPMIQPNKIGGGNNENKRKI